MPEVCCDSVRHRTGHDQSALFLPLFKGYGAAALRPDTYRGA